MAATSITRFFVEGTTPDRCRRAQRSAPDKSPSCSCSRFAPRKLRHTLSNPAVTSLLCLPEIEIEMNLEI